MSESLDAPIQLPERETRTLAFDVPPEVREDNGKLTFVGHAAVFDRLSNDLGGFQERIVRGAFRKVLDANPDVRFLVNHDGLPLARTANGTLELREDPKGLRVYAELADTQLSRDLAVLIRRGDVDSMSFAFGGKTDDAWTEEEGVLVRTIRSFGGLFDVSAVTYPAYAQTDAAMRSIAGVQIFTDSGDLNLDEVRQLAWRIHHQEVEVDASQRSLIDHQLQKTGTVSPWIAQQALMAMTQEPELRGAIPGRQATVTITDVTTGERTESLAAYERRLEVIRRRK